MPFLPEAVPDHRGCADLFPFRARGIWSPWHGMMASWLRIRKDLSYFVIFCLGCCLVIASVQGAKLVQTWLVAVGHRVHRSCCSWTLSGHLAAWTLGRNSSKGSEFLASAQESCKVVYLCWAPLSPAFHVIVSTACKPSGGHTARPTFHLCRQKDRNIWRRACECESLGSYEARSYTHTNTRRHGGPVDSTIWRKFRSQTSDNMDRWKAEMGRVKEDKRRRKKIKKRKSEKKEVPGARKGRQFAKPSGGSKSRLPKPRWVRSHVVRWEMKSCTPLWREEHFQVKMYKTPQLRITFFLEVWMSKKWKPLWREAHFEVKMLKAPHVRTTFWRSDVVLRGRRKGLCTLSKVNKTWGFCSISKKDGRRGTFEEDLQRCIFRDTRSTRDMFIRAVRMHFGASDLQFWEDDLTGAALRMTWHHFFVAGAIL